ncbi:unnamed protein product [Cunninghamella echinulata]
MKSGNVPIIPNKPSYLSNKENMKPSSPLHTGTTVQPNNSHPKLDRQFNTDGRHKRYQRPTPQLSIHHLYLYSSSSTKNLLDNETHTSPVSSYSDKTSAKSPITKNSAPSFLSNNTTNNSKQSSQYNGFVSPTSSTANSSVQYKSNHGNKENNILNNIKQTNNVENKSNNKLNSGYFEIKPISKDNFTSHSFIPSSTQFYSATSTPTSTSMPQNIKVPSATVGKSDKYDSMLAQLVDMGFDTNKAQIAIENCTDKTLQGALDILIQSSTDNGFQKKRSMFESTKPTPAPTKSSTNSYNNTSSNTKQTQHSTSTTYPPKPLRKNNEQNNNENDSSDDDILTNEKEWQKQQEIRRKNYLESLKKQKQHEQQQQQQQQNNVPQPNSKPYVAKQTSFSSPLPPHPKKNNTSTSSENDKTIIDSDIIKKVIKARNHGNDLYKLGYYGEAEKSYSQALAILPQIHDLSAIISNNRAAARLKNGQYRQCLIDCNFVIERAHDRCRNESKDKTTILEGGISFQWHDQLVKALHRKATALEATMRLKEAQSIYEELISIDSNDGKARQGLIRCQPSSTPPPPTTATKNKNPTSSFTSPGYSPTASSTPSSSSNKNNNTNSYFNNNTFNSNGFNNNNKSNNFNGSTPSSSAFPDLDYSIFEFNDNNNNNEPPSKAVKEMRERQAKLAKEEAERLEKTDIVDIRIQSWKKGKEKNLRALLTTLDTVLWPSVQWQGATINELLEPKKVKICYMKAIAKVHPDKLSSSATVEQRLLASGVFTVLNQAWDDFRTNNKM